MLKLSNALVNLPVMSLRTGAAVGTATSMIINPNNLKVEGWHVQEKFSKQDMVLVSGDIRDITEPGILVNDQEVLSPASELVRLKPVMDINFQVIGKQVVSQGGQKYGKVSDFAVETKALIIKKLYANQSIIKSLAGGSTSIDRSQIVEITDTKIIIEDASVKEEAAATSPSLAG